MLVEVGDQGSGGVVEGWLGNKGAARAQRPPSKQFSDSRGSLHSLHQGLQMSGSHDILEARLGDAKCFISFSYQ